MKSKPTYRLRNCIAAAVMISALSWLTVCLPYVYSAQKELAKQESRTAPFDSPIDSEESNPLSNTTEEKAPTTSTINEEFLHDHFVITHLFQAVTRKYKCGDADIYNAYHGELTVPPPEAIS